VARSSAATPLALFVTLGLPAGVVGVAWPHMRVSLGAPLAGLGLLLLSYSTAYFATSVTNGVLGVRLGTPVLLVAGCAIASAGMLGLALATQWWMVPLFGLLVGGGSGSIDAAVNAHISLNRGVRYMGWLHASWAVGAALGPILVVLSLGATGSWRASFATVAVAFLATGLIVATRRRDWALGASGALERSLSARQRPSSYRRPLILLIGLFLIGGGLERAAGDWSYTQLTAGRALSSGLASTSASLFWAGLAGGRIALGMLGNRSTPNRLLDVSIGTACLAALAFWLAPVLVAAFIALPLLGVAVSILFPVLLSITPTRVGTEMTAHTVGYELAAGTLGGGGLPAVIGLVLQAAGLLTLGPMLTGMAAGLLLLHAISRLMPTPAGEP
jgi:fucose permease